MNNAREKIIFAILEMMKNADDRAVRLIYAFTQGVMQ